MDSVATNKKAQATLEMFIDNSMKRYKTVFKKAVKELGNRLIDRTPAYFPGLNPEAGRAKGNWNFSESTPDLSYIPERTDPFGEMTKQALSATLKSTKVEEGTSFYLANATPHFKYFEFGMYPLSPKKGSPVPGRSGEYEIRSEGGFSKMAPGGVIGVVELQWESIVTQAGMETRSMALGRSPAAIPEI